MKRERNNILTLLLVIAIIVSGCKKDGEIPVNSVSIDKEALTMLVGEQYQLSARAYPQEATDGNIIWNSSDNAVASVTPNGLVTAESVGTATIIAKSGDVLAKCEITVVKEGEYKTKVSLTKTGNIEIDKLIVVMPAPSSNEYQEISNLYSNSGVYINTNNSNLVLYHLSKTYTEGMAIYQTFDYEPKHIEIDFSKKPDKKNIYDNSISPDKYLDSDGTYIDLNNSYIKAIGDSIWAISDGNIDYARKCYEYEATLLKYIKGGWRSIKQIIQEGGGECGDFTTFYVNLLRYKGIPARHNMGIVPEGGWHIWADFYSDDYGWIPVDVTFKNGNPEGNYFGKYDTDLIIVSQGLTTLQRDGLDLKSKPLQSFWYYYWTKYGSGTLEAEFTFNGHMQ